MLIPHGYNRNRINIWIGQHVAVIAIGFFHAEFGGHLRETVRCSRAQSGELKIGDADNGIAMDFTEPSETNNANAQSIHTSFSLRNLRASVPAP